jgi:hypothetical protein
MKHTDIEKFKSLDLELAELLRMKKMLDHKSTPPSLLLNPRNGGVEVTTEFGTRHCSSQSAIVSAIPGYVHLKIVLRALVEDAIEDKRNEIQALQP